MDNIKTKQKIMIKEQKAHIKQLSITLELNPNEENLLCIKNNKQ